MNLGRVIVALTSLLVAACDGSDTEPEAMAPVPTVHDDTEAGVGDAGLVQVPDEADASPAAAITRGDAAVPARDIDASMVATASDEVVVSSELDASVPTTVEPSTELVLDAGATRIDEQDAKSPGVDGGSTQLAGDAGPELEPPELFLGQPNLTGNTDESVPQAAIVTFELSRPVGVAIEVTGGGETWTLQRSEPRSVWQIPIIGVRPATTYQVTVHAGEFSAATPTWTSPELPQDFPMLDLVLADPERMEPGMTLFVANETTDTGGFLIIVDQAGLVRWYRRDSRRRMTDHRRLENGNFLFLEQSQAALEIDALGAVVGRWYAKNHPNDGNEFSTGVAVDADQFHHEIQLLPNDNLLVLSSDVQVVEDYPTSTSGESSETETTLVTGTVILEFTRSGEVVKRISLLGLLDPTRVVSEESLVVRTAIYPEGASDWAHGNAVIYDPDSDAYYVSARHQSMVAKIDRETEELVWILSAPDGWRPPWQDKLLTGVDDLIWPSHQHAVELLPGGLGLYDNGNGRPGEGGEEFSRAVRFEIDEELRTVREVWSYGPQSGAQSFYSPAMGDADWQPVTGNVLMTNSILSDDSFNYGQLLEVTPSGERVFTLNISRPDQNIPVYRADRIADIRR